MKWWQGQPMRVNQRRSDVEIIAEMLRIGANGAAKTKIMYNANMSYLQMKKYLGFLVGQGYIDIVRAGNPSLTYRATDSPMAYHSTPMVLTTVSGSTWFTSARTGRATMASRINVGSS